MLRPEDRVRTERKVVNGIKYIRHVHTCKDCGKEILVSVSEEKTKTGYCQKCAPKYANHKRSLITDNGEKHCNVCDRFLPTDKFLKKGNNRKGFSACCSKCHNLKRFGITALEYEQLHDAQNGCCGICNQPETANDKGKNETRSLAVDHDHITGEVRGLLCTNCNIGIGHFKDNIKLLESAIRYIKQK